MKITILIIAGTRPEFIKLAPLIKCIERDDNFKLYFIQSGQHYDYKMCQQIVEDLELTTPMRNIEVGSGSQGYQVGKLTSEIEKIIEELRPDLIISQGDTNTVLASGLATRKINKAFLHLEAGIRSFDKLMPEEINRILIGKCSKFHLCPTERAALNLLFEGEDPESIYIVGNTIVDSVTQFKEIAERKSDILQKLDLNGDLPLILITLHRPSNVDDKERLKKFIDTLIELEFFQFIFPVHPRTKKNLKKFGLIPKIERSLNILLLDPLGYLDFYKVFSNSLCVLTDSGGIQEEASILKIPCITLRNNTERPETIEYGSNVLVGRNMKKLKDEIMKVRKDSEYLRGKENTPNPLGDGQTSQRILEIIKNLYSENKLEFEESKLWEKIPKRKLKIIDRDIKMKIGDFERENKCKVQLLFNKEGNAEFPYKDRLLKKNEQLLLKIYQE
jgi:UDP-N-acetylglucosamine 2-epimerase (non-hydrolysing)